MTLTVCPTPIGNLDDVTPRQRRALEAVDLVACEDTRRCGKLMEHLGIERDDGAPRLVSYHEHNADEMAERLVDQLRRGAELTLTCDAGTPGVSDPGYRLVRAARKAGIEVMALPGPVAGVVALSASGLPTDAYQFLGFAPTGEESRRTAFEAVAQAEMTTILYESPQRLVSALELLDAYSDPAREVCLARELTKVHEEYVVGRVGDVREEVAGREAIKGEIVLIVGPAVTAGEREGKQVDRLIDSLLDQEMSPRGIKDVVAETFEVSRSGLYERIDRRRAKRDDRD